MKVEAKGCDLHPFLNKILADGSNTIGVMSYSDQGKRESFEGKCPKKFVEIAVGFTKLYNNLVEQLIHLTILQGVVQV